MTEWLWVAILSVFASVVWLGYRIDKKLNNWPRCGCESRLDELRRRLDRHEMTTASVERVVGFAIGELAESLGYQRPLRGPAWVKKETK